MTETDTAAFDPSVVQSEAPRNNPPGAATGPSRRRPTAARKTSKADLILKKLHGRNGATIAAIMALTGWQAHTVRGFLSAVVRKQHRLRLVHTVGKDGSRRYRIEGNVETNPGAQP